jgi:hypothetical protein
MSDPHEAVKYEERSDQLDELKESLEFARVGDTDVVRWTCPQCKFRMEKEIDWEGPLIGVTAVLAFDEEFEDGRRRGTIDALCDCGRSHEGRPEDGTGCGHGARIIVELP